MILIDCLYVNNGGGKVLLDLLVENINSSSLNVQFLFDKRVMYKDLPKKFKNNPVFLTPVIKERLRFYKKNRNLYSLVFCFGNVPPPIKLSVPTYTYLHNVLYLEKIAYENPLITIRNFLKKLYIRLHAKNTQFWIVQTELLKQKLSLKWGIPTFSILTIPFFSTNFIDCLSRPSDKALSNHSLIFLYVSNGYKHKNHLRLFSAFERFSIINRNAILQVTVSDEFEDLHAKITELNSRGVSIINLGILNKNELQRIYSRADIVLFPSLFESFGLGLIEAVQFGLPVIAANRDYVFEVIEPSAVFDPLSVISIAEALEKCNHKMLSPSILKVNNKISEILQIFKSNLDEK